MFGKHEIFSNYFIQLFDIDITKLNLLSNFDEVEFVSDCYISSQRI